ncbi:MAG TPA: MFS transporter [Spirochaetia bacterium]|nr:MFS transporter [Spirochaetia bacterium]
MSQHGALTPARIRRAMNLNIILGSSGILWLTIIAPGTIMNVFFKNQLGASAGDLGLLVASTQLATVLNLVSVLIVGRLPRLKPFWIAVSSAHRVLGFVPAVIALLVARGGSKVIGAQAVLVAIALSYMFANLGVSGWWRWMSELVPEETRATFFGRRSAVLNTATMAGLLAAVVLLDLFKNSNVFWAYFGIFSVAAAAGLLEILLYIFIPEPVPPQPRPRPRAADFTAPLRDRNFVGFSLSIAIWLFSVNILGPFVAPYITADDGIGAPITWLGIMMVITQLSYIATAMFWGMLMDRLGRKPVVLLGSVYPLSWIIYLVLGPGNYVYILPVTALVQGIFSFAILDGSGQLMLTLTPEANRTAYVAWYAAITGVLSAAGSLSGGALGDLLAGLHVAIAGRFPFGAFQAIVIICFVLCGLSIFILSRIREGREKPVGFLLSALVTPTIFRTFAAINVLGRSEGSARVARALRGVESGSGAIAVRDIIRRLDDPDEEVREEAARALGRIGSAEAVEPLARHLRDRHSTIRVYAARALGRIGDPRAVPWLIEGLASSSEELVEACCRALGRMDARDALKPLLDLFSQERPPRVIAAASEAASRLGAFEAALDILPRMQRAESPILMRQLAIALGNLLGAPGEFYAVVTGDRATRSVAMEKLEGEAQRNLHALARAARRPDAASQREALAGTCRRLHDAVSREDHGAIMASLLQALLALCRVMAGKDFDEEEALGYAFMRSPRLGLGLWFAVEVKTMQEEPGPAQETARAELREICSLLGLYFMASYREEGPEEEERSCERASASRS